MSKKLDRSRDQEIEDRKKISLIENMHKNKYLFQSQKHNIENKNYEVINIKDSPNDKNKDDDEENLDNESDEYYEEEDEEGGEIEDDEDDEMNSEFKNVKKRKLDNTKAIWSRKKSDINEIENDDSLFSADIVIKKTENKNDKNNETINKEKAPNIINESKINSFKKTNFVTTPFDISNSGKNISNIGEQKAISSYFNVNNDLNNNKSENNSYNIDNSMSTNINLSSSNVNINNQILNNNENSLNSNISYQSSNQQQANKEKIMIPPIFNKYKLYYLIKDKMNRFRIKCPEEKIFFFLEEKLKEYLKIYLLRLITISRIRNANFNLYSNNPNGQIHYKFKTYNWTVSNDKDNKNVTFSPAKVFDILFTSNLKKRFDLIEEYVELYNKKTKFEKLSSCKEKYEESNKAKGIESSIKITDGPNPQIKLLPGRRTKKKNNTFFKEMRKKIDQTKKKEDLNKQKSFTKNTLEAFLNDSNTNLKSQSFGSFPNLIDGGSNSLIDMSSKMSDTMSHNNLSYTNNYINNAQNEISMNIFTYFDPTKDGKIIGRQKKRINLKDFIFLLENSNEYIPNKIYLLNKASIENTKNK